MRPRASSSSSSSSSAAAAAAASSSSSRARVGPGAPEIIVLTYISDAAWSRVVEDVQNYPRGRPRIDGRESSNDGPDDGSMQSDAGHASRQACVRSLASTPVALRDPRASQTRERRPTVPTRRSESKSQRPSGPQPPEGAESGGPTPRGLGGHRVPPRVADEPCHGPHARKDTRGIEACLETTRI